MIEQTLIQNKKNHTKVKFGKYSKKVLGYSVFINSEHYIFLNEHYSADVIIETYYRLKDESPKHIKYGFLLLQDDGTFYIHKNYRYNAKLKNYVEYRPIENNVICMNSYSYYKRKKELEKQ